MTFHPDPSIRALQGNWTRDFTIAPGWEDQGLETPQRGTPGSAAYDLMAAKTFIISPGKKAMVPTGIVAVMPIDEVFLILPRSSLAVNRDLDLVTAVIDSDYAGSPENGGHIKIVLRNTGDAPALIQKGERIGQGIFLQYFTTDSDSPRAGARVGGFGSTGK